MCGIAGLLAFDRIDQEKQDVFSSVLAKLEHRGYSRNETAQIANFCLLGANRLEIVGRDRSRQPFISPDRRVAVVFNGEIYNFVQLRNILKQEGYEFKTDCDTEILLKGYECWGIEKLSQVIKGIFAFLVYDNHKGVIMAVRDPFGVKPLYWTEANNTVLFGSEIKSLAHFPTEIHELRPGEIAFFKNGTYRPHQFFRPDSIPVNRDQSFRKATQRLKELFSRAVKKRVQTDLPVAVLIGGIDSAIVLCQAIKYHDQVKAYTIGKDDNVEDVRFARKLCADLQVPLKIVHTNEEEVWSLVPDIVRCIESFEPNHIRGGTFSYLLAREIVRDGYRIALCGEGADEIFAGYPEFAFCFKELGAGCINKKRQIFVQELYKTQLKRVDRTSMAFTLEVRVPFLDFDFASFALTLPTKFLLRKQKDNIVLKYILREAFKGELPDYALEQNKRVLTYGAGFGTNAEEGPFFIRSTSDVSDDEFRLFVQKYPKACFRNKEEVYYFKIMEKFYPVNQCPFLLERPMVNRLK